jgi:hypothetical protein
MSTSPPLEEEPMPLNIVIASYGAIGKACLALLQQDGFLNDNEASKYHQVTWMDLDSVEHRKTAEASTAGADIVLIIGNNTSGDPALAAAYMAMCCAEKRIPCYALLCLPAEPKKSDPLLISLRNRASNTLFVSQDTVPNTALPKYLATAVLNMLHPITGRGIVGVDFADIKTILACGKKTAFAVAEASGEDRAALAAQAAVAQLPDISTALSMLCNVTCGFDLKMEEWALIGDLVREQAPDDCVVVCSTTLNPDWEDSLIQAGITVCMKKKTG